MPADTPVPESGVQPKTNDLCDIIFRPIGTIHSPFTKLEGMPIQPQGAKGVRGEIRIKPELVPGLKDIEGFSHLILLYHFHLSRRYSLEVKPFLDDSSHGVFATRAPNRPNSIGLSIVRLIGVEGSTLHIEDVDVHDATPLLDMKPYVPAFDSRLADKTGWLTSRARDVGQTKADGRFT